MLKNVQPFDTLFFMLVFIFLTALGYNYARITDEVVTDMDGNRHTKVALGSQVWLVENLKTTKFNDGESIHLITDNHKWSINN